jgi:hypothetical protein
MKKTAIRNIIEDNQRLIFRCNNLGQKLNQQQQELQTYKKFVPPGHFYSPIPSEDEIKNAKTTIPPNVISGIDLNTEKQFELVGKFQKYYNEMPFPETRDPKFRYYFKNDSYAYSDGFFLHSMIRHLEPNRIIEVGSGFSSCMTIDTNQLFFDENIKLTFIEPYPEYFYSLIREDDKNKTTILESKIQDVPLYLFKNLKENDILFIDSTHVSKFQSDVNYIIHEILPVLQKGVYIHFHDVFYPFEYPIKWIEQGRAWSEQYLLRSFLQFNTCFDIVLFNTYLETMYRKQIEDRFPLIFKNTGGSIWIKRIH